MLDSDEGVAVRAMVIGVLDAVHAEGAQAEGPSEEAADAAGDAGTVPVDMLDPSRHDLPTGSAFHLHGMIRKG